MEKIINLEHVRDVFVDYESKYFCDEHKYGCEYKNLRKFRRYIDKFIDFLYDSDLCNRDWYMYSHVLNEIVFNFVYFFHDKDFFSKVNDDIKDILEQLEHCVRDHYWVGQYLMRLIKIKNYIEEYVYELTSKEDKLRYKLIAQEREETAKEIE